MTLTLVRDAVFLACCLLAFLLTSRHNPKLTMLGSAGWGRPNKKWLTNPKTTTTLLTDGFLLGEWQGREVALPRSLSLQHGVIFGGTGVGKSRAFFLPNAKRLRGTSLACSDPKSELWKETSGYHKNAVRYAPGEPEKSACFNWIPLCSSPRYAELCARALVETGNVERTEQAWLDLETAFLSGLFAHAATLAEPTPLTAYYLFTRQDQNSLMAQLLNSSSDVAREQARIFEATQERMRGSIVPVVAARLQFLRDPAVTRFTSASLVAPRFGDLKRIPTAVYWCLRESDVARLRPLTSLFFTLLLAQLSEATERTIPVTCLLDEFANIGTLPSFDTTISLARGRNIALWLGVQSLSQLSLRYGREAAQTILSNCGTKIALHGLDYETAKGVADSLGEATIAVKRRSVSKWLGFWPDTTIHVSEGAQRRQLLTADEVRRIGQEEAIALITNERPLLLAKKLWQGEGKEAPVPPLGAARATPPETDAASSVAAG